MPSLAMQSNNQLTKSEYQHLLNFSPTIIYRAVPSGDFYITYISNNLFNILGYTPDDIYRDADFWHDHIHPEDRAKVFSNLPQLFVKDKYVTEYRFRHKKGHYLWLHNQLHVKRDVDGNANSIVGSLTDITERVQAESEAKELAKLEMNNPNAVIRVAVDYKVLFSNPAAELFLDAMDIAPSESIPEDWRSSIDTAFKHKTIQQIESSTNDVVSLLTITYVDDSCVNIYVVDITRLREAEVLLKEKENRIKAIFNTTQDGIITINNIGLIDSINPSAINIFGYTEDELIGRNVSMLLPDSIATEHDGYLKHYTDTRQARLIGKGLREVTARRKDGSEFPFEMAIDRIHHNGDEHFVAIFRDITERKKIENEILKYSNKMQELVGEKTKNLLDARDEALAAEKAMSSFLSNMSHELRTPLHGILSFANFGIKEHQQALPEELADYFAEIIDSGKQLLALINDLLDLSKLRAGKMVYDFQFVSLNEVTHNVAQELRLLAKEKNIEMRYHCSAESNKTMLDRTKISQVVRNLLSNSIKFSPENSLITITVSPYENDSLILQVTDQGVGIPTEECEFIFDIFSQSSNTLTNAGGTGLGLPICREIVEQGHKGKISACNNANGGAVLAVILPIIESESDEL